MLNTLQMLSLFLSCVLILIQNRGSGLSSTFGGSNEVYLTRRGVEKWVVYLTWIFIALFCILRIYSIMTNS
jgi:protein translocase SecG subunit